MPDDGSMTRRRFLGYIVSGVGGAIAAAAAVPLVGYFMSPAWRQERTLAIAIAQTSEIPVGEPVQVRYEERVADAWVTTTRAKSAWVVTRDGQNFTVFDPRCTHLNCPYFWDEEAQVFHCPCHGGEFAINGEVIAGPPPRPLDRLEHEVRGQEIVITGRIIKGDEVSGVG